LIVPTGSRRGATATSSSTTFAATTTVGIGRGKPTDNRRRAMLAADHAAIVDGFTRLAEATETGRGSSTSPPPTRCSTTSGTSTTAVFTIADDGEQLVARQKDLDGHATPAANSIAAVALVRLGA
jgi:hypothetical protein